MGDGLLDRLPWECVKLSTTPLIAGHRDVEIRRPGARW
jgi:hypothetical protein